LCKSVRACVWGCLHYPLNAAATIFTKTMPLGPFLETQAKLKGAVPNFHIITTTPNGTAKITRFLKLLKKMQVVHANAKVYRNVLWVVARELLWGCCCFNI